MHGSLLFLIEIFKMAAVSVGRIHCLLRKGNYTEQVCSGSVYHKAVFSLECLLQVSALVNYLCNYNKCRFRLGRLDLEG